MRTASRRAVVLAALVLSLLVPALSARAASADTTAADRTRQTLLYGIDSQVMDVLTGLRTTWDSEFTPQLVTILTDKRSTELQTAVLEIFRDQGIKDGEAPARAVVDGWEGAPSDLAVAAIRYLASIKSEGLAAKLAPIVDSQDNGLATAAIAGLGQAGDSSSTTLLLAKLASLDYPESRKSDIILALGNLKDKAAVDALVAIVKNTDEERIRRLYAADALGKIGDPRALPVLRDMFGEKEALERQYAASALARFDVSTVFDSLIQALRDEDAKVRESSANALARPLSPAQTSAAVPILSYKAEMDPASQVRIASIKALGELGTDAALRELLSIYSTPTRPLDSRETALNVLVKKALAMTLPAITKVVDDEWKAYDTHTLESTAKVVSTVRAPELRNLLVHFLDNPDPVVRSYGARGIALNGFSDLKERLNGIAKNDPNPGTRKEAELAAGKL
jgi:HEAT repeat protein